MNVEVDNVIRIKNPSEDVINYCKTNLQITNPQFEQNQRLGFPTYNIPRILYWYEKSGNDYILPFGTLKSVYSIAPNKELYNLKFKETNELEYNSKIKLYDYQEQAKEQALKSKNGIIVMAAGSGKTQTALQLIAELGLKTLWITHTHDLLNQSFGRAKDNMENVGLGKIAAGKIDIGTHITFATVQTLVKMDLTQYKNEWDCIIVDERTQSLWYTSSIRTFL